MRKKIFTKIDFISFVAGVLELFSGFSVLSFIELSYVASFLIFSRFMKKKKKIVPKNQAWVAKEDNFDAASSQNVFKNFNSKNLHLKIIWVISVGMSCLLCISLIAEVKRKIPNSRVIAIEDHGKFTENVGDSSINFFKSKLIFLDNFSRNFIHPWTRMES